MKKNNPRRRPFTKAPLAHPPARAGNADADEADNGFNVVSNTPADTVSEMSGSGKSTKWIGIYIAVLAVILAICSIGGGDASKTATRANIEASNTWSFYQAKTIRKTSLETTVDEFQLLLVTNSALPEAVRKTVEAKIATYQKNILRYETEPETGEGRRELAAKAKKLESERDFALAQDPYFDYSTALLQIAIVLASASIIAGGRTLVAVSGGLAVLGVLLMMNGFTLAFNPL